MQGRRQVLPAAIHCECEQPDGSVTNIEGWARSLGSQDLGNLGDSHSLMIVEEFFVELLAPAEPDHLDRQVVRVASREPSQVTRHVNDANGFSHVEYIQAAPVVEPSASV